MRVRRLLLVLGLTAALSGCSPVHFTEKRDLSDPVMSLEEDPTEVHLHQKFHYSREGSVGGIGEGGGGGCGCF